MLIAAAWLFTLSFVFSNYWSFTSSPNGVSKSIEKYVQHQESSVHGLVQDTVLLNQLAAGSESEAQLDDLTERKFGFFLYKRNAAGDLRIVFWNTQSTEPAEEMLYRADGNYMVRQSNGHFELIKRDLMLNGQQAIALALIPVKWQYFIENEYLQNNFVDHKNVDRNYNISFEPTGYPVNSINGKTLFYMAQKTNGIIYSNDWITLLLRMIGSLMVLFFIQTIAIHISRTRGAGWSILFLAAIITGLRALSYFLPLPVNFKQFDLFHPDIYGSNIILGSLGDLLINALLFFWLILFTRLQLIQQDVHISVRNKGLRWILAVLLVGFLVLSTLISGHVIRSLVADSQISFDVTNFFSLNVYSVFGFIVLCCVSMGYFMLSQILFKFIDDTTDASYLIKLLIISFIGLAVLSMRINYPLVKFELFLLIWLLGYTWMMSPNRLKHRWVVFSTGNALFWLFIFSVSISIIIIFENRVKELEVRKRVAEKLSQQSDPTSERLLNMSIQGFGSDFFTANFSRLKNDSVSHQVKDSLINSNFFAYLNRYDTRLFLYDASQKPLSGTESLSYDSLNTIHTIQGKKTTIEGLKYYETAMDLFKYIYKKAIVDSTGSNLGYLFILAEPKHYKSEALYPELFKRSEDFSFERSFIYAYAVYNEGQLATHINDYPFPTTLNPDEIPPQETIIYNRNGYSELWYKASDQKIVVITKKSNMVLEAMTLFAYLFCAFLFLVGIFQIASLIVRSGLRWSSFRQLWQLNIRAQIYSTTIFISIFSFIVIGAATIIFFINRYDNNNRDRLSRTIQVMASELNNRIDEKAVMDDVLNTNDTTAYEKLSNTIDEVSEVHNADINLYSPRGDLEITSHPLVYNRGVLSRMMEPRAFYYLDRLHKIQHVQKEKSGKLEYLSIYVPVQDQHHKTYAYLNIPYFSSQIDLKQEISNFLVTIINLNAFIFLIGGVIAVVITNRITDSFSLIGEKMREVNLGKHNEEIVWRRSDEIGGLVKEYNKMVKKLEGGAVALAKTEREGAWREMARQVAHEIKNPLTPMKLSMQYLQKAIQNNAPNIRELTSNVAKTLIEQIDHLSKIAADFSQFANIGNSRNEVFDLHELLNSLVGLHAVQEKANIHWHPVSEEVLINADKTQVNRLFTNLLQNALEAIPEAQQGSVQVQEILNGHSVLICIKDNGSGIPPEMQSKIFTPNFTTKTSGTGLGLAMSKGIVEQAKGKIWFETMEGKGTTFFVELPLAEPGLN